MWDDLKTLDKSKVNAELMVSWRILEDADDPKRLGFSYGMMETGILVVAIPEGMLISWDPKKTMGTVKIERNGTQIAAVKASAGHYLDKDVAKLREYAYKIHRDRGGEGRWGMLPTRLTLNAKYCRIWRILRPLVFRVWCLQTRNSFTALVNTSRASGFFPGHFCVDCLGL